MRGRNKEIFQRIEAILDQDQGVDAAGVNETLGLLGGNPLDPGMLKDLMIYSETLPKAQERPYTEHERFLHFLWDAFDKLPACLCVTLAIPLRRLFAERLFGKCGKGVIIEENLRFNFPAFIELGQGVFFNRNVFLDSKGGIEIGDFVGIAEDVRIFSHGHSEAEHLERSYHKVTIGAYAKIYSGVTILPGVTMGEASIAASGAMITKDVEPGMVAAGVPAKVVRERKSEGRQGDDLGHIWLF
ncbi:MAG: acyltransferase [Desulfovibrio sp.]|nr:MAG: acyltransferase [Desulfovibrio sp.]